MLHGLVQQWDPNFVFLSETKLKKNSIDKKKANVGFINGLVVPSHGRSGGLALLWRKDISVDVRVIQTGILMPLLLKVQGLNGGLPGSMEILRSIEGRSHGSY